MPDEVSEKKVLNGSSSPPTVWREETVCGWRCGVATATARMMERNVALHVPRGGFWLEWPGYLVRRHLAIRLDAVLEAVELPAGVTRLDAALAHVDGDDLTL